MEQSEDLNLLLNQLPAPAFLVLDHIVSAANPAAMQHMIVPGTNILPLLLTGEEEYRALRNGCLYLTLKISDIPTCACVSRIHERYLFQLEQEDDQAELQSMALAAQALRAPLSAVMTVADRLFPLECFEQDADAQKQVAQINRGLFQMLRIISNMSDAYRYTAENQFSLETKEITCFLQEIMDHNRALVENTGVNLTFSNLSQPVFTLANSEKLERAVNNILSNALKFSQKGSTISARLTRRKNLLCLTVENQGAWSSANQGNVYHHFRRSPGIEDSRFGIGLGMVLIRSAAAAHGGTVLMENLEGTGTRITMTIAIRKASSASVRSPVITVDYAGERDHMLIELSDVLPASLYLQENLN